MIDIDFIANVLLGLWNSRDKVPYDNVIKAVDELRKYKYRSNLICELEDLGCTVIAFSINDLGYYYETFDIDTPEPEFTEEERKLFMELMEEGLPNDLSDRVKMVHEQVLEERGNNNMVEYSAEEWE